MTVSSVDIANSADNHHHKSKPIIFNGPMVRAILAGKKSTTRRVLKPQPLFLSGLGKRVYRDEDWRKSWGDDPSADLRFRKGDILWVRETWQEVVSYSNGDTDILYKADNDIQDGPWRPSIYMPKQYARIWLRVTGVKVERVRDISERDAIAEGVELSPNTDSGYRVYLTRPNSIDADAVDSRRPLKCFEYLWNNLNEKRGFGWDANPWVVAVTFERVEAPK